MNKRHAIVALLCCKMLLGVVTICLEEQLNGTELPQTQMTTTSPSLNHNVEPGMGKTSPNVEWLQPVDGQLRALREHNIEKAYNDFTTDDFRKATSLELFKNFIEQYPIFFSHHDVSVEIQALQKTEGEIMAILNPNEEAIKVQYRLVLENGQWKIWNLNLVSTYSASITKLLHDTDGIKKFVSSFFDELHKKEVEEAYDTYTSKDFKKKTPLNDFEAFVKKYALLESFEKYKVGKPSIVETTATVNSELTSGDGKAKVEIVLGIQNDAWKVWSFKVVEYSEPSLGATLGDKAEATEASEKKALKTDFEFSRVEVGLGVDAKGEVINPHKFITMPTGEIYVNLFLKNGKKDDRIHISLEHQGTRGALPKVSTTLQQDGDSRLSFSFAKPSQGWPKGAYVIYAESSTGSKREFTFEIR